MKPLSKSYTSFVPYSRTLHSIVLASYDVGEADRFVILLTREEGRLAARVPGARKPASRLKSLLPLTRGAVELKESKGNAIVSCASMSACPMEEEHVQNFLTRVQGSELLLALLSDGDPVPEIFDAFTLFLDRDRCRTVDLLAFTFRLLALLGVLPETEHRCFAGLTPAERAFVASSVRGRSAEEAFPCSRLSALARAFVQEHATRPLRAGDVATACSPSERSS